MQTGVGDRKKGFSQEFGIKHRFRIANWEEIEKKEEEEEDRLSAIATGRGFASRLVGRGPFNRCCYSIGPRYTTDSFCYRGFHPAGPSGPTEGLYLIPSSCSSEPNEKHERGEDWERVGQKSFTNLTLCQEQEDPSHPFLLLNPGRELFPTPDGAQGKRMPENPGNPFRPGRRTLSLHIFTIFLLASFFFFLIYIRSLDFIYLCLFIAYMREISL